MISGSHDLTMRVGERASTLLYRWRDSATRMGTRHNEGREERKKTQTYQRIFQSTNADRFDVLRFHGEHGRWTRPRNVYVAAKKPVGSVLDDALLSLCFKHAGWIIARGNGHRKS